MGNPSDPDNYPEQMGFIAFAELCQAQPRETKTWQQPTFGKAINMSMRFYAWRKALEKKINQQDDPSPREIQLLAMVKNVVCTAPRTPTAGDKNLPHPITFRWRPVGGVLLDDEALSTLEEFKHLLSPETRTMIFKEDEQDLCPICHAVPVTFGEVCSNCAQAQTASSEPPDPNEVPTNFFALQQAKNSQNGVDN